MSEFEPLTQAQTEGSAPETESTSFSPLTLDRAKQLAAGVVAEFGVDHVYTNPTSSFDRTASCQYVHGDEPGCIVGQVLHRAGVALDSLAVYEGVGADGLRDSWFGDEESRPYLRMLQYWQDNGYAWGIALSHAEARTPLTAGPAAES